MARWQFRAGVVLAALLLAGCNYRIASQETVDVCALALDAVTAALKQTPIAEPRPNVCVFHTTENSPVRGSIQINLLTDASQGYSGGVEDTLRILLTEAEQAYGPRVNDFAGLPKVAMAFGGNPPSSVVATERGVLLEMSINGELRLGEDEVAALTRELWTRVTTYKPPSA
ncbi:MAG: hypothetical protein ABIY56_01385 [Dokdonella sp.]